MKKRKTKQAFIVLEIGNDLSGKRIALLKKDSGRYSVAFGYDLNGTWSYEHEQKGKNACFYAANEFKNLIEGKAK